MRRRGQSAQGEQARHESSSFLVQRNEAFSVQLEGFRSAALSLLGEPRLAAAIDADISGEISRCRALDADTKGALRNLHQRVGAVILFESTGGQRNKIAHLPELRFALGNPEVDTTSIDNAATALESRAFFIRKVSGDGFQIRHQATLRKVVHDRRASLDLEMQVRPTMRKVVKGEFEEEAVTRLNLFPKSSTRLRIVVADPVAEWTGNGAIRDQVRAWTQERGEAARDFPAALVWCMKKPGTELQDKAEMLLAWKQGYPRRRISAL